MTMADSPTSDILYPLSCFECDDSKGVTRARILEAEELVEPYRTLLAHDRDMTGTLETYFKQPMGLKVHVKRIKDDALYRQVTLFGIDDRQPKEFGAIRIDLNCFTDKTRQLVAEGQVPLGRVLREHKIAYVSNPSAYLEVTPDQLLSETLNVTEGPLYGRKNELTMPDGRAIAQIIEILPPLTP